MDPVPRCPYFPVCGKTLMFNTVLLGGDLANGTVTGTTIVECCNACARRQQCRAYTFDPAKDVVSWGWALCIAGRAAATCARATCDASAWRRRGWLLSPAAPLHPARSATSNAAMAGPMAQPMAWCPG